MKKWMVVAAVVATGITASAELVMSLGTNLSNLDVTAGAAKGTVANATSNIVANSGAAFLGGTDTALGYSFDLVVTTSDNAGVGISPNAANYGHQTGTKGPDVATYSIQNVTGLGAGESLIISSIRVGSQVTPLDVSTLSWGTSSLNLNTNNIAVNSEIFDLSADPATSFSLTALNKQAYLKEVTVSVIPEPATLGLIIASGGSLLFIRRRIML